LFIKEQPMPWSADDTIPSMKKKSKELRALFAKVANEALAKGQSEEEAVFAGLAAVRNAEDKENKKLGKAEKPAVPWHLKVLSERKEKQEIEKAQVPDTKQIQDAEFDDEGRLVILLKDGTRIVTKRKAIQQTVNQSTVVTNDYRPFLAMKEPMGFETRSTSQISFNDATRTFTLAPAGGTYNVWIRGREVTKTTDSVQINNEDGLHLIYLDGETTALMSTHEIGSEVFTDHAVVGLVYWRVNQQRHIYFADERHGMVMDGETHRHLHLSIAAQYRRGLGLFNFQVDQNGSLDSHAQFACENGGIADEDIEISIINGSPQELNPIANLPVFYKAGSDSENNWYVKDENAFPLIMPGDVSHYTTGTRPAYNYFNGTNWVLSEVPNNQFLLVHALATNDIENPIISIVGKTYPTKSQAREAAISDLQNMTGLPFLEFVKLGTVIYECANSYLNAVKSKVVSTDTGATYIDYRQKLFTFVRF
jgi:hypothetical protein